MAGADTDDSGDAIEAIYKELRRRPCPDRVVLVDANGKEREVSLRTGKGRWQHAAETLYSMVGDDSDHIECRDKRGKVLRTIQVGFEGADDDDDTEDAPTKRKGRTDDLAQLAKIMNAHADKSVQRVSEAHALVLSEYRALATLFMERIVTMEKAWGQTLKLTQEAVIARATSGPQMDPTDQMAMAFIAQKFGLQMPGAPLPPNAGPSGAGGALPPLEMPGMPGAPNGAPKPNGGL